MSFLNKMKLFLDFIKGIEMAQCFARLGSQVTVMGRSGRIMGNEDEEATEIIKEQLERESVVFKIGFQYDEVTRDENGTINVHISKDGNKVSIF